MSSLLVCLDSPTPGSVSHTVCVARDSCIVHTMPPRRGPIDGQGLRDAWVARHGPAVYRWVLQRLVLARGRLSPYTRCLSLPQRRIGWAQSNSRQAMMVQRNRCNGLVDNQVWRRWTTIGPGYTTQLRSDPRNRNAFAWTGVIVQCDTQYLYIYSHIYIYMHP